MATMILKRLPTQNDVENIGLELEAVCEAFDKNSTGPFSAEVEITKHGFSLGGWLFTHLETDWYQVVR